MLQKLMPSRIVPFALAALLVLSACASKPATPAADVAKSGLGANPPDESIEITYLRGMNSHRFLLLEEKENGRIRCFRDHQLLKEFKIGREKFTELAKASADVLAALERHPAQKANAPCRTPFTLKIRDMHEIKSVEGCRSADEGAAVGKLIKDVEFIMMSSPDTKAP